MPFVPLSRRAKSCTMSPHDYALKLLQIAEADEYAADKLIDDLNAADSIFGFHCQQAAEKILKAVLAERCIHFQKTHNLSYLIQLIADSGQSLPTDLAELDILNPFAVTLRYDTVDPLMNFDRQYARRLVKSLREWAEQQIQNQEVETVREEGFTE